ncbi:uncharacterized protein DFL_001460 [Arthrobotrys flagrans]|uniref:Uncharacterized protein n=1 Tax=Arthrobotrys flagrans TaxID=97331 RepID=A0A437A852_ARTFL|nr:hypothetical protein DFL_001460 [Arthrobotrys flagrans]
MAAVKLPVKVRMGVRDLWEPSGSPMNQAISAISSNIGKKIDITVDWGMLWTVFGHQHPDPGTFIPYFEEAVKLWASCFQERLDNDTLESWTDELLEKVKAAGGSSIKLEIGVSDDIYGSGRPETLWDDSLERLKILFPKRGEKVFENVLQAGFAGDFEHLFNEKAAPAAKTGVSTLPIGGVVPTANPGDDEGWLPSLQSLGRPEALFETSTPYLIYVRKYGDKELHIEGSHQGSLTLLCEYFQKWVRKDRNYNGNVVEFEKQTSLFGVNSGFDYIKITCNRWELLNPTPFLAFIEIVLKYRLVEASSGVTWFYRRDHQIL